MLASQIIYVIGASESPVKIGLATDLNQRLMVLQIGNPDPLVCHHFVRVPAFRAKAVESAAHLAFQDRHRRGEWFDVDWREAAAFLSDLAEIENACKVGKGVFEELHSTYGMKPQGREAVWKYLDKADRRDPAVQHINGYLLNRVGTAAYAAFSLVVAQRKEFPNLPPGDLRRAKAALAKAINALCEYRPRSSRATDQDRSEAA
jgi:hypothetical protein